MIDPSQAIDDVLLDFASFFKFDPDEIKPASLQHELAQARTRLLTLQQIAFLNGQIYELQDQKRREFVDEGLRQNFLDAAIAVHKERLAALTQSVGEEGEA